MSSIIWNPVDQNLLWIELENGIYKWSPKKKRTRSATTWGPLESHQKQLHRRSKSGARRGFRTTRIKINYLHFEMVRALINSLAFQWGLKQDAFFRSTMYGKWNTFFTNSSSWMQCIISELCWLIWKMATQNNSVGSCVI